MVGNNAWVSYVKEKLEADYPNLTVYGYKITSPDTIEYNCVGWAAEDDETWWWPDPQNQYYWPPDIIREVNIEAFQQAYRTLGYEICQDDVLEAGFQKIAIYVNSNKAPTHVARQLQNGKWTSKIGSLEDIEHNNLQGLTGQPGYGDVACIMKKAIKS
ncbi:hypothetical protein JMG10_36935 [Nostoc ellipsosporum NOK]|nr:hypothetical protein [Nostoc ellipsosporum NOK]